MSKFSARAAGLERLWWIATAAILTFVVVLTWMVARATTPVPAPMPSAASPAARSSAGQPLQWREDSARNPQLDTVLDPTGGAGKLNGQLNQDFNGEAFAADTERTQLTYFRLHDGMHMGTANEHNPRPALSLSKLFIAYYVLEHGDTSQGFEALEMLSDSSDVAAEDLFTEYPESINEVAEEFGLYSTSSDGYWGTSLTSTYDVAKFITRLIAQSPEHPILVAMALASEKAEDGYTQDFGTARLSNVLGTKWGWSNDKTVHSSVSFGANFVVAASVNGSAEDLTSFVRNQVTADNLRAATTRFLAERDAERGAERDVVKPDGETD